ncbi:hypothetical protein DCAR_0312655 [Daucus carota subsp. sativus]|uniref:E2F/DP family winged-helix DNA-binding domain-containing protein n=1 Tax=Daucus carota subsp. sativus TaxID=79200 RepID=A0AAF0WRE6_DAUCS|nr:hypothetical protein DCAR_0312655 [Daucus carota subsp. sativus]
MSSSLSLSSYSSLFGYDTLNPSVSNYSRKDKSLALLCSNFLKLYNRDDVECVGVDAAAAQLGVERRRIYDIVNIMESIGVLVRKAKNQYCWKGFDAIPQALHDLQISNEKETERSPSDSNKEEKSVSCPKTESRKEKSLALLAKNFVKLFLRSGADIISLDSAATALPGDVHDTTAMRTKARRLYDIANVFASMNLIEKSKDPESGEPAFRQLVQNSRSALETGFGSNDNKRRTFGTEITNTASKRFKDNSLSNCRSSEKVSVPTYAKQHNVKTENDENSMKQHQRHQSKGFVFGPFSPASIRDLDALENNKVGRIQDWEQLASTYFPRYQNQAVSDLITHYADAWKSWLVEVDEKKPTQTAS